MYQASVGDVIVTCLCVSLYLYASYLAQTTSNCPVNEYLKYVEYARKLTNSISYLKEKFAPACPAITYFYINHEGDEV